MSARSRSARVVTLTVAVMAPLVILLLDGGRPAAPGLLADRLVATAAGIAIVLAVNAVFARLTRA